MTEALFNEKLRQKRTFQFNETYESTQHCDKMQSLARLLQAELVTAKFSGRFQRRRIFVTT